MSSGETSVRSPITAVIVGAGHRSLLYASYAKRHPDQLRIVGVVDPDPVRRRHTADLYRLREDQCWETVEQLVSRPRLADAAINGTMDTLHVRTSLPLLEHGYDLLLEKPIGVSEEEVLQLQQAARRYGRTVLICHVLRYAPFYAEIRRRVAAGEIGDILHMQTEENVSYHHMAMAFVRGKWNSVEKCKSPMLMAKCCHDLDILAWMKSGVAPVAVSSMGKLTYFRPERAPEGAGTRCLVDCRIERECVYSARKNYVEQGLWRDYVWQSLEAVTMNPGVGQMLESLRSENNPYGRCVWRCDNDVVDHQTVIVEFADGSTAAHSMVGGTAKPCRTIHLIGTRGEIVGTMEDGFFFVRRPDARAGHVYHEEKVTVDVSDDMHGGGDLRLVEDFVRVLRGESPSLSTTSLDDSIYGHLIGFTAEKARLERSVLPVPRLA